MDPTPESLFAHHLAGNTQGDAKGAVEAAAFEALLEEHPEHADALKALQRGRWIRWQGSQPLTGDKDSLWRVVMFSSLGNWGG